MKPRKPHAGQFQPGVSGNSKGRPVGKNPGNKMDVLLKNHSDKHGFDAKEKLFETIYGQAVDDNCTASQSIIISRLIAAPKAVTENVTLARLPKNLFKRGEKINSLILAGELSPSVGRELLDGIAALMKISEATQILDRLTAIEKKLSV